MTPILRLYPLPGAEIPLEGAYLGEDLRQYAARAGRPFLYANFVASLDGRIALPPPGGTALAVPKSIANERDWRLYQELAVQADLLLSSGRYLRDWAAGRAQEILQIDDPRFTDLRAWRRDHGLPPQADFAIVSASLDFPIPSLLTSGGRRFVVATIADPDPSRVEEIERRGGRVIIAGSASVDGGRLLEALAALDYRTIYCTAGPRILHMLVAGGALDFLYVTAADRLLGGMKFATLLEGPPLDPPVGARIRHIYLDEQALGGLGQLFLSYQVEKP